METGNQPEPDRKPPWHFRWAKWLIKRGIRGPGLVLRAAHKLGLLNRVVRYEVRAGITIDIPLYRWENLWDADEVRGYEARLLDQIAERTAQLPRPIQLIDCGADIGLFSVLLFARLPPSPGPGLDAILAFEPNPAAFPLLQTNLRRLPVPTEAQPKAVSDFSGRGELRRPDYDPSDHARYLVEDPDGTIEVTSIDRLNLSPRGGLVLKIDVEGGEGNVLRGAQETLRQCASFVIIVEAHRRVFERTAIEPLDLVRFVQSIRPCEVSVSEAPGLKLRLDQPLFEQVGAGWVFNLVIESKP